MSHSPSNTAFEYLYNEHHSWLRAWLRQRLRCQEHAADIAHDTFVKVLQQQKHPELREPKAYLSTLAKRLVIDDFRRKSLEKAYLEALAQQPEAYEVSAETLTITIDTLVQIDTLLDEMEERTRTVFLLAQLDGLSYVEISCRLDVSVNTVRKHFARAMTHCLMLMQD